MTRTHGGGVPWRARKYMLKEMARIYRCYRYLYDNGK